MTENNKQATLIQQVIKTVLIAILLSIVIMLIYNVTIFSLCKIGGANNEQASEIVNNKSIIEQWQTLNKTPGQFDNILNDKDREQIKSVGRDRPILLIMYRIGCPDCEEAYPYLKKEINALTTDEKADVFWIPSRTKEGSRLIQEYRIKEVPTLVYIDKDSKIEKTVIYDKNGTKPDLVKGVFDKFRLEFNK